LDPFLSNWDFSGQTRRHAIFGENGPLRPIPLPKIKLRANGSDHAHTVALATSLTRMYPDTFQS
jgi:hypothetical protein